MSTELTLTTKDLTRENEPKKIREILYDGLAVTTFSDIDVGLSLDKGTARRTFNHNKDLFIEDEDYHFLPKSFQDCIVGDYQIPNRGATLLTLQGYTKLTTFFAKKELRTKVLMKYFKAHTNQLLLDLKPNQPPTAISVSTTHVNRTPFRIAFFSDRPHVPWVALEDLVYIYPTGCSALAIKQQIERNFQGELDLTRLAEAPSPTAFTRVEHAVDYAKRWTTSASALINERIEAITLKALDTITQLLDAKPVTQALQLGYDDMEIDPEPPIFDHCPSGYTTFDAAMGQYGYQSGFSTAGFKAFLDDLPEFYYRPNLFDDTSKSRIWRQQDIIRALSSQSDTLALPPRSSQLLLASC